MSDLSKALENLSQYKNFSGRLSRDGQLTDVRMQYKDQEVMEVRGLQELPSYLRFDKKGVKFSPKGRYAKPEEAGALNVYRILDPRTMRNCLLDLKGEQIDYRWKSTFSYKKLNDHFCLIDGFVEELQARSRDSQEVSFVIEKGRIAKMSFPDLSGFSLISIEFFYQIKNRAR